MKQALDIKRCSGIILSRTLYGDYDAILTLYTRDFGLLTAIVKGAHKPGRRNAIQTDPFTEGEICYTMGRSAMHKCLEITPKNSHLKLRRSYEALDAACMMSRTLHRSQLPEKASPALYDLFLSYLSRLPEAKNPQLLATSFQLKVLRHDGILSFDGTCSSCNEPLKSDWHCHSGEAYCLRHAPLAAETFTSREGQLMMTLTYTRSFQEVEEMEFGEELPIKVNSFFYKQLEFHG